MTATPTVTRLTPPPADAIPPVGSRTAFSWLGRISTAFAVAAMVVVAFVSVVAISNLRGGDDGDHRSLPAASTTNSVPGTPARSDVPPASQFVTTVAVVVIPKDQVSFGTDGGWGISLYGLLLEPNVSFSVQGVPTSENTLLAADIVTGGAYRATFHAPVTAYRSRLIGDLPSTARTNADIPAGEPIELLPGDSVVYPVAASRTIENPLGSTPLTIMTAVIGPGTDASGTPTIAFPSAPDGSADARLPKGLEAHFIGFGTVGSFGGVEGSPFAATLYLNTVWAAPGVPLPSPEYGDPDTHPVIWPADLAPGVAGPGPDVGDPPMYALSIRWKARG